MNNTSITSKVWWILFASLVLVLPIAYVPGFIDQQVRAEFLIILTSLLVAIFGIEVAVNKSKIDIDRTLVFIIIMFFGSNIISYLLSPSNKNILIGSERALGLLPQLSVFILFILLLARSPTKLIIRQYIPLVLIPFLITLLFGFIQFFTPIPNFELAYFQGRIDSLLTNPNNFALWILLVMPIGLFSLFSIIKQNRAKIFVLLSAYFVSAVTLMLTGCRTGLYLLLCETIFGALIMLVNKQNQRFRSRYLIYFAVILTLLIFVYFELPKSFSDRYKLNPQTLTSLETRLTIWKDSIPVIQNSPLFGYGQDQFAVAFEKYSNSELLKNPLKVDKAHNLFLDILVERGFFGLITTLLLWGYIFINSVKSFISSREKQYILIFLLVAISNYMIFLQMNFTDVVSELYLWIILAVLAIYSKVGAYVSNTHMQRSQRFTNR